ncbi:MAG: diguanylate cyclase domain-containing protein [Roseburia sp.]
MKKGLQKTLLFLLILASFLCGFCSPATAKLKEKRILFISSYSYAWDTVQIQIEGIKAGLGDDVVIDYEFMDTKRFPDEESLQIFYDGLKYRLERLEPYDVVILGDDAALKFAMEHQEELFSGIPLVFEGINNEAYAMEAAEDPLVTGVLEKLSFQKNIDFALTLYPDANQVVAILDDSITGEAERKSFYTNAASYPELAFSEINTSQLTQKELKEALSSIAENTILIYIVMTEDADGNQYTSKQSVQMVAKYASVPALRMVSGGIGNGLLGGNIVSMELSGKIAAQMATEIAGGKDSSEYDVVVDSPNIFCIDEAVMRKYNLDLSLIPEDATIVNHTPTFLERNKEAILPVTVIILLFAIVLLLLFRSYQKQTLLNHKLKKDSSQFEKNSLSDALTGLPNRTKLFADLSELALSNAAYTLLMFDIDSFKQINDTYGHICGDTVLKEMGVRLTNITDDCFDCYRLAGDEFICVLKSYRKDKIDIYVKRCLEQFTTDFQLTKDTAIPVHVSLGIAICPDDSTEAMKLLEYADQAMYSVKKSGKNSYRYYSDLKE